MAFFDFQFCWTEIHILVLSYVNSGEKISKYQHTMEFIFLRLQVPRVKQWSPLATSRLTESWYISRLEDQLDSWYCAINSILAKRMAFFSFQFCWTEIHFLLVMSIPGKIYQNNNILWNLFSYSYKSRGSTVHKDHLLLFPDWLKADI